MPPASSFARLLTPGAALLLPGVSNALAARVVADLGFAAAYVTGAGIANTLSGRARQRAGDALRARCARGGDPRGVSGPAGGRCRHRLRQRHQRDARGAHARARGRRRDPDRGPGVSQALRPFLRQGGDPRRRDGRQDQGRGGRTPERRPLDRRAHRCDRARRLRGRHRARPRLSRGRGRRDLRRGADHAGRDRRHPGCCRGRRSSTW